MSTNFKYAAEQGIEFVEKRAHPAPGPLRDDGPGKA